jgi:flagellar biosynthesis protein FliR
LSQVLNFLNQQDFIGVFLVFCRIGTACMLLPGFAIARAPLLFRVMLAFVISAAVYPFLKISNAKSFSDTVLVGAVLSELFVGFFFGFLCAIFAHAVRFFASFTMALIGLAGIPGQPVDDLEPNPAFVVILSMTFTMMVFALDIHLISFRALLDTYNVYPLGQPPKIESVVEVLGNTLSDSSLMALQASSPFILHSIGINFALGLIGKLTPQLQAYFALMGVSTLAALLGLYIVGSPLLSFMISTYADFLASGL